MRRILVLDFESTGRDTSKDRITEIGAILWEPYSKGEMNAIEWLLWDESYPPLPLEVQKICNLTDEKLKSEGHNPEKMLIKLQETVKEVNYVMAYNKEFDENLFKAECNRHGLVIPKTPWICGLKEMPYKGKIKGKYLELIHMAASHQIPLTKEIYGSLHRALGDVRLLLKILSKYNWDEVEEHYLTPKVKLVALTQKPWEDDGKSKDAAKAAGFRWNPKEVHWWKELKESEVTDFRKKYPDVVFDIVHPEEHDVP